MIKNKKQLQEARRNLVGLEAAQGEIEDVDDRADYQVLIDNILGDLREHLAITSGEVRTFDISCLDDLGPALIKARIARGWTHRDLAGELEVSEQAVQKAESTDYENSGIAYVSELLDALEYEVVGCVRPKQARYLPTPFVHFSAPSTNNLTYRVDGFHSGFGMGLFSNMVLLHEGDSASVDAVPHEV